MLFVGAFQSISLPKRLFPIFTIFLRSIENNSCEKGGEQKPEKF